MKHLFIRFGLPIISVLLMPNSLLAQSWDGSSSPWTNGEGTQENPYLIENAQNLAYFSEQIADGETYSGKFFKLTTDLDMGGDTGQKFPMIGKFDKYFDSETMQTVDSSQYFKGTFDGGNHIIDNIHIVYVEDNIGGTGLFACTTDGTTLRNITLGKSAIIDGGVTVGGIVGQMNGGLVEKCCNEGVVNATGFCSGGIVGVIEEGLLTQCVNKGKINGTTEVGGILGQGAANGKLSFCYNTGDVTASGFGGAGIAGALYDKFSLSSSYNAGKIQGNSSLYLGSPHAIVSDATGNYSIDNCYYVGSLSGVDDDNAKETSKEKLEGKSFVDALNGDSNPAPFEEDINNINKGLPVLSWENEVTTSVRNLVSLNKIDFKVNGNELSSDNRLQVYDLSGRAVGAGKTVVLNKGTYIVRSVNGASKLIIK